MKRLGWLVLVGAVAVAAFLLPEPETTGLPEFRSVALPDVPAATGVWYCPLTEATFERDSLMLVASTEASSAQFSFPNPVPGEESEAARLPVGAPGAVELLVSDVALRGDAPGFVELATAASGTFAVTTTLTGVQGDRCIESVPKVWYLPGGSTPEGRTVRLRMFNPFPETAIVTVRASSEFGDEPLPDLQGVVVAARSWRDIEFEDTLKFRDALGFTISEQEGFVLPALVVTDGTDEASWPGVALATTWEFPVTRLAGLDPAIAISNPGDSPVSVAIDLLTPDGPIVEVRRVTVAARTPEMIPFGDLVEGPAGVRVRADGPVAASVIAAGSGGLAGTVGSSSPARRWLVPGVTKDEGAVSSIWLMNAGETNVTVTVQPLGSGNPIAGKVIMEPGTVRQVIAEAGTEGYLIDSLEPITAGWSVQTSTAAAFIAGIVAE